MCHDVDRSFLLSWRSDKAASGARESSGRIVSALSTEAEQAFLLSATWETKCVLAVSKAGSSRAPRNLLNLEVLQGKSQVWRGKPVGVQRASEAKERSLYQSNSTREAFWGLGGAESCSLSACGLVHWWWWGQLLALWQQYAVKLCHYLLERCSVCLWVKLK